MSQHLVLNEKLYEYVKSACMENGYSEKEKVEFCLRFNRACKDNPDLPPTFVADCLLSLSEPRLE